MLDISREYGILAAACYRRLHSLEKAGLIKCVRRELTEKGKMQNIYSSQLKNAHISLEDGRLRVRFTLASGMTDEFGGDWSAEDMLVEHGYDSGDRSLAVTADISDGSSGSFDAESFSENPVQSKKEDSASNGEAELVKRAMHELERVVSVSRNALQNIRKKAEETQRSGRKTEAVLSGAEKVADAVEKVASKTKKRSGAGGKE
jgi:predicted transcriptional regulator